MPTSYRPPNAFTTVSNYPNPPSWARLPVITLDLVPEQTGDDTRSNARGFQ